MSTLSQANREWATRPEDERFKSIADMHAAVTKRWRNSKDGRIDMRGTRLEVNGHIRLIGGAGGTANLTHWSAGQLCTRLGVPRDLLTKLDPSTASAVLNDRLPKSIAEGDVMGSQRILITADDDGQRTLRALHGDQYDRVWDSQITKALLDWLPEGWRNPVAYAKGKYGAGLEPSGLYAGDRDMFAFFIDGGDWTDHEPGTFSVDGEQFNHGFFVWNSEVGAKSFGYMTFMFDVVCGNHYVWNARNVSEVRKVHRGNGASRGLYAFREYLNRLHDVKQDEESFVRAVRAAKAELAVPVKGASAAKKLETLDLAYKAFNGSFTKNEITLALDAMLREEKNVTGSRYDWLAGFTAVAREYGNADDRSKLEVTASKVLLTPVK